MVIMMTNKWEKEGAVPVTEKRIKIIIKDILSKKRGDELRQRKKEAGIEECFWTVSNDSLHIDEEHFDEMDDL